MAVFDSTTVTPENRQGLRIIKNNGCWTVQANLVLLGSSHISLPTNKEKLGQANFFSPDHSEV